MAHPDYTEFDKALLTNIAEGCNTMTLLDNRMAGLTKPFRVKDRYGNLTPEFRIIDRRLQALRKKGVIRFAGKAWTLANS